MRQKAFLTLDVGTTRVKAHAFLANGSVLAFASAGLQKNVLPLHRVEQDPNEILRVCKRLLRIVCSRLQKYQVVSFGMCTQRETVIAWDRVTRKAITPALSWQDERTRAACKQMATVHGAEVRRMTGLPLEAYFSASKMAWILEYVDGARGLQEQGRLVLGTVDTWLLAHLCVEHPVVTDVTNASRTLLFNIHTQRWDAKLLRLFGVSVDVLPRVRPSLGLFGRLDASYLGYAVPVLAVCGDQQASMAAAGMRQGVTKITYGTGVFVMQVAKEHVEVDDTLFLTMLPTVGKRLYVVEGRGVSSGALVTPHLKNPVALEGVLRKIAKHTDGILRRLPFAPTEVFVDGGVSRSRRLVELQSQISGVSVVRNVFHEGASLGLLYLMRDYLHT